MSRSEDEPPQFRLLHTMLRVADLDASLAFYCGKLGMTLLRRREFPAGKFTLAFVGYGPEEAGAVLELTYNWDRAEPYELGSAYGHIAIGCADIYRLCERLAKEGVKIPRPPGAMMNSGSEIAFIEDPDGYRIELIQGK